MTEVELDIEKYAETLYNRVKAKFPSDKVTMTNIFDLIRLSMEEAEKFGKLAGKQKKELVLRVVQEAVTDLVVDEDDNKALAILIDNFADLIIDQFVDINFGHLAINVKNNKCFAKLFPCIN
tara:strand:- start:9468 stop:9833 length:366 start_codon:yes stop_codon:yes gene_type:complete